MKNNIHFLSFFAQFFLEREMFQTKFVDKITTHIMFNKFFSRKSCRLCDNVHKYGTARQTTDDNMAHALCMLDS